MWKGKYVKLRPECEKCIFAATNKNMTRIAERLSLIEESQTIGMAKKTRALQTQGISIIPLHFGEPDFDTPLHIKEAAIQAIRDGKTKYTPVAGIPELRQAVSEKFRNENGLFYSPEEIVISTGAKHAIMNVIMSTINPGDEVLVPTPFWVSYSEMIKFAEGVPIYIKTSITNQFKPDWEEVKSRITPRTKMFLFSSPNNPTGNMLSADDMAELAKILAPHPDILVVADEIYEHIIFGEKKHVSIGSFEALKDRVVTVNGVSKAFAMTGWRIGYIGAPLDIAKACEKLQSQFTSGTNSIAQFASLTALTTSLAPTLAMTMAFKERRDFLLSRLSKIEGFHCNHPEGAFYLFPEVKSFFGRSFEGHTIENAYDLCIYLLEEGHVSMVSGEAFGNPECIRLSYATSMENLSIACDRIESTLAKLS